MFAGALFGAPGGYFIQYWDEALNYPINVGGRPHNSWPAFIVGTFDMLLCAIAAGFFAPLGVVPSATPLSSAVPRLDSTGPRSTVSCCASGRATQASRRRMCAASSSAMAPSDEVAEVPRGEVRG